ncbi:tubulin folding cofactor D C terminal-domain-containing protein [Collybia nuda]|uniref:Tubulin folding cofactor D C terminal-domain-containing protein n=1 Tax=Collybia nuda TaxID=64659 RepID=A0A9P5YGI8_9AGAR|nr:tubulin folding cofactor D C terminal-domain-containing protein [Collybia nuda]
MVSEGKLFATFERHGEFADGQKAFLSLDLFQEPSVEEDEEQNAVFGRLLSILDEYQEQSYLLDPFLEDLVAPVVECLKSYAKACVADPNRQSSSTRVFRMAHLLYSYVKCRGYKTIIRFFPHEIADLSIALDFMLLPDSSIQDRSNWPLRYMVLIWLSLICMLPFDLAQFDDADRVAYTATALETSAKSYLGNAGLAREGAAILLSRLYMRKDTNSRFQPFIDWAHEQVLDQPDIFTTIGLLRVLCEVVKSGPVEQVHAYSTQLFSFTATIQESSILENNTVVRKFKLKLVSRIALRLLATKSNPRQRKGRVLAGVGAVEDLALEDNIEVPEKVEQILEQLFASLQDKDTIVRWSAAKSVARISERLPTDFADQVLETVMGLFAIHSIAAASLYDLPAIAESTWHGASLACAEMARRGLIRGERLPELIEWLSKALYFDIRKGAHSIGSNVRDAAAYVLWALARTQDPSALVPYASHLAQYLSAVALYDREIHIRRAASAAFQEHVGRNSLFPHGIDVLAKTDFYAVSVRRNAFLIAAPQVAIHPEYRETLLCHILDVVLRHWDHVMRELGSQSLHLICLTDLPTLGPKACIKATRLLESIDIIDLHGGLLTLCEVAIAYRDTGPADSLDGRMREIFQHISIIPLDVVFGSRNAIVTAATCRLISITLTQAEIQLGEKSAVPHWRKIIDFGLKHRVPSVQEAAAEAMRTVSKLVDWAPPVVQQSLGTVLGALDYNANHNSLPEALECLIDCAKPSSPMKANIEARRNCYLAFPRILSSTIQSLPRYMTSSVINTIYETMLRGLDDYSVDERGDVGSWIRLACIQGLTSFSKLLISNAGNIPSFGTYFPASNFHRAIAGILKQGVERLDNVRQEAGENFVQLISLKPPVVDNGIAWELPGRPLLEEIFKDEAENPGWNDGQWLYPRAVRLLGIIEYRKSVLAGLVLSIGSRTESTHRPLALSLASYAQTLPLASEDTDYTLDSLVEDLLDHAKTHLSSNAVVVPALKTFNVLLEADALERLSHNSHGLDRLRQLLSVVTRNVGKLKINLLRFEALFSLCSANLIDFLGHEFPSVRRDTAEHMYLVLQSVDLGRDTDDIENILLETEWSSNDIDVTKVACARIVEFFSIVE